MKKYLIIIEKWVVCLIVVMILIGIIYLMNIDFNVKRYIGMLVFSLGVFTIIDLIKIKRSR